MKTPLIFLVVLSLAACTRPDSARRAAEHTGLTNVAMTGYRFFGCGKDDIYADGFTATDARGSHVSGVVCAGPLKGSTVRFDD